MKVKYLRFAYRNNRSQIFNLYLCSCGNEFITAEHRIKSKHTKSCGCLRKNPKCKHGHFRNKVASRTYQSWSHMRTRCNNYNYPEFYLYGGRGIKVCDRWNSSFINFLRDMGNRPAGKSLDRINVNGNYEPSNCKWSTPKEQANNRR